MRALFLERCLKNRLIPHFLKFKIPANGTFVLSCVENFQRKLLKIEHSKSKEGLLKLTMEKDQNLTKLKAECPDVLIPSIAMDCHYEATKLIRLLEDKHDKKIKMLSEEQRKPEYNVNESIKVLNVGVPIPDFVRNSLSQGPRSPVLDRFDKKNPACQSRIFWKKERTCLFQFACTCICLLHP